MQIDVWKEPLKSGSYSDFYIRVYLSDKEYSRNIRVSAIDEKLETIGCLNEINRSIAEIIREIEFSNES